MFDITARYQSCIFYQLFFSCTPHHSRKKEVLTRLHFSPVPVFALGSWISSVFYFWGCTGTNCGLSQAVFTSDSEKLYFYVNVLLQNRCADELLSSCRMENARHHQETGCQVRLADGPLDFKLHPAGGRERRV